MDPDTMDRCKENIQPLMQGRKPAQLGVALAAETDVALQQQLLKEQEQFELLIRVYDGPDPLEPCYEYVSWLEQSFLKYGRDLNLIPLLEHTISTFKSDERYLQDERFIKLIVKYINMQANSLELYQIAYSKGIGTLRSLFYKSWAEELHRIGDSKQANQVYLLGLDNGAQPRDMLEQAQTFFQLNVARKMMSSSPEQKPLVEDVPRQVLGKLNKKLVSSTRLPQGSAGIFHSTSKSRQGNTKITIFEENKELHPTSSDWTHNKEIKSFPKLEQVRKENTMKAGKWNKPYSKSINVPSTPCTPSFTVHEDEKIADKKTAPMCERVNALKPLKVETCSPVAIFEPEDPSIKPMYCKNKIYAGGKEFQMEEIRAAYYNRRYYDLNIVEPAEYFMTPLMKGNSKYNRFLFGSSCRKTLPSSLKSKEITFAHSAVKESTNQPIKLSNVDKNSQKVRQLDFGNVTIGTTDFDIPTIINSESSKEKSSAFSVLCDPADNLIKPDMELINACSEPQNTSNFLGSENNSVYIPLSKENTNEMRLCFASSSFDNHTEDDNLYKEKLNLSNDLVKDENMMEDPIADVERLSLANNQLCTDMVKFSIFNDDNNAAAGNIDNSVGDKLVTFPYHVDDIQNIKPKVNTYLESIDEDSELITIDTQIKKDVESNFSIFNDNPTDEFTTSSSSTSKCQKSELFSIYMDGDLQDLPNKDNDKINKETIVNSVAGPSNAVSDENNPLIKPVGNLFALNNKKVLLKTTEDDEKATNSFAYKTQLHRKINEANIPLRKKKSMFPENKASLKPTVSPSVLFSGKKSKGFTIFSE